MASATRMRVHGVVLANPGMSVRTIATRIDVNETTASYHLRKLLDEDKVAVEPVGRELLWYPAGHGLCPVLRQAIPLMRRPSGRAVALAFDESPLTCMEIFRRTGEPERGIRTTVNHLVRIGLVEKTAHGRAQLVDGARTCIQNAARESPCALWGKCPVSQKWTQREKECGLNEDEQRKTI